MHILRITILSRGELHTSKRAILKICFDVLDEYCMMYSEKQCAILKDIFYMITNTMRFFHFSNTTYCEKGVACARGFIFDTEADMC